MSEKIDYSKGIYDARQLGTGMVGHTIASLGFARY